MDLKSAIQSFARELDRQDNASYDLWSWLPSYRAAKKHHGDCADEFMPMLSDVLIEATEYIASLVAPEIAQLMHDVDCPCGDLHLSGESDEGL